MVGFKFLARHANTAAINLLAFTLELAVGAADAHRRNKDNT